MGNCMVASYRDPAIRSELLAFETLAYDFLLKPLLLAVELCTTRLEAAITYRAICSAMETGPYAHEVPVYIQVLAAVELEGQEAHSAVNRHRMALYEAHSKKRDALDE